jgi:hypothetical protein
MARWEYPWRPDGAESKLKSLNFAKMAGFYDVHKDVR